MASTRRRRPAYRWANASPRNEQSRHQAPCPSEVTGVEYAQQRSSSAAMPPTIPEHGVGTERNPLAPKRAMLPRRLLVEPAEMIALARVVGPAVASGSRLVVLAGARS